jgi:large subunit ribosomal protein L21
MYAIVEIAGQQFKVEKEKQIFVHRLEAVEGNAVDFEKVLLIDLDGEVKIGQPVVDGAKVTATVLSHVRGDKITVFKKKNRKGYQVRKGHRQDFTKIKIEDIVLQ